MSEAAELPDPILVDQTAKGYVWKEGDPIPSGKLVKNDPRIWRNGKTSMPKVEVEGEGMLRAMRHVMENRGAHHDKTADEKIARMLFVKDKVKFFDRYQELEAADAEKHVGEKAVDTGPDLGHDAAVKVLNRLLKAAVAQ